MIKVKGYAVKVDGTSVESKEITFMLVDKRGMVTTATVSGKVVVTKSAVSIRDSDGYFEADLFPNDSISKETKYLVEMGYGIPSFYIYLNSLEAVVDISEIRDTVTHSPLPTPNVTEEGMWVLKVLADGTQTWSKLPAAVTGGDMTMATYDADADGVVDKAKTSQDVGDVENYNPLTQIDAIYQG